MCFSTEKAFGLEQWTVEIRINKSRTMHFYLVHIYIKKNKNKNKTIGHIKIINLC